MKDDIKLFISFTEREGFSEHRKLKSDFYPPSRFGYTFLELCCYHGSVNCFKFLRTKFNSKITKECLQLSFLGKNPYIINECLKDQKPDYSCMKYAIISHNIDFVCFLVNEYKIEIDLNSCCEYYNLKAFLVYLDRTQDVDECFTYSSSLNLPILCEYLLSHFANINALNRSGNSALHIASEYNFLSITQFLLDHGAFVNIKNHQLPCLLHQEKIIEK
ncbi:hypothetical protein TVAG_140640 [Trichomonas vaginalis G3]|uniref:DUF3447 domain-containing protein n=1 Tax=Trichomonas vaginalis (strain ATCC PRA-98 / G3) TaxID=412133 RepID=A2EJV2_TRIV3|nr:spectrin binding [Trichomonas vaginalis G3]EAY07090.1 hypothetical protein TVAG_140640 [Trichomonas vaginalis G3]KAI5535234.1 spectrin binding [Trichomonas vaginalis G3]|eukprot:XP_001319313.1 hypothetical protein [Trichomonas vaginalis G3]